MKPKWFLLNCHPEVELGLEGAGHRRGVDPVGQVRRVSAHRGREGGLADVDRFLAQGALRKEGTLSCGPQCVTLLPYFSPLLSKKGNTVGIAYRVAVCPRGNLLYIRIFICATL